MVFLLILGVSNLICSIYAKDILERHGYKTTYLVTEFFYETRILKKLIAENHDYSLILKTYRFIVISLFVDIALIITIFFLSKYEHFSFLK